ncbi:nuclear pore complex protein NUP214 isoform X1 [Amborella trichopoda]|uniref:nuclear pore complex protein NUP214 isoform X1 n=4 Tax=Amborella trichopoda TaxID=13333 RepID=UPI0009C055B5|nr:nuclear pore complex protein NUP214 isoform X1 [Amborella trichopoda]|eukprot:XP_020517592.1 nuclear pore complex protein NUP214 isoform X1 [Amborella trichopoda]
MAAGGWEGREGLIELEAGEGESRGSSDVIFQRIGASVPFAKGDWSFDPESPPAQVLAISDRFGVLFAAHSQGFCVVKTKEIIKLAEDLKEERSVSSVKELSIMVVPLAGVYLFALSTDSQTLAASVAGQVYLYSVTSLLNKEEKPFFSWSLGESSHVKDFKWKKNKDSEFIVLSSNGLLSLGAVNGPIKDMKDDVDAVDWSVHGKFIVLARKSTLSIVSVEFEEKFHISLPFQSWNDDEDSTMTVDSIKWVRHDSIVIGCIQLTKDGKEDCYSVHVITSNGCKITEASSSMVALSFSEFFLAVNESILPNGHGPYLFANYLDIWGLVVASNRKTADEHLVLLGWFFDGKKREATAIEIIQDKWRPRIELQENGDDNLVVGFGVDKTSTDGIFEIKLADGELKEISPYHILVVVTIDGHIDLFRIASISAPPALPEVHSELPDSVRDAGARTSTISDVGHELSKTASISSILDTQDDSMTSQVEGVLGGAEESVKKYAAGESEPNENLSSPFVSYQSSNKATTMTSITSDYASPFTFNNVELRNQGILTSEGRDKQRFSTTASQNQGTAGNNADTLSGEKPISGMFDIQSPLVQSSAPGLKDSPNIGTTKSVLDTTDIEVRNSSMIRSIAVNTAAIMKSHSLGLPKRDDSAKISVDKTRSIGFPTVASEPQSGGNFFGFKNFTGPSSLSSLASKGDRLISSHQGNEKNILSSSRQEVSLPRMSGNYNEEFKNIGRGHQPPGTVDSVDFMKEFDNIKHIGTQLDKLLSIINEEGGPGEAVTVFRKSSIKALEEKSQNLLRSCRVCKSTIEKRHEEMQSLWDKTLQVVAWRLHTESIVKQAADDQYWKSWNCQNLSPEFELKRQKIMKASQNLRCQFIELEKHFNALELDKFGENGGALKGRTAFQRSVQPSRQIQSLHSLYNTMNSQLTVAERLADILSDQMSALNIEAPSVKRRNAAKELFESIGLIGGSDLFKSPEVKESEHSSYASKKFSSSSFSSTKESPPRKLSSAQLFEPETARRRRNSMDKSWINVEPPKTTIKRTPREEPSSDKLSLEKLPNLRNRIGFSPARQKEFTPPARPLFPSSPDKEIQEMSPVHAIGSETPGSSPSFFKWSKQTSEPLQIARLISPKTQGLPETIPQASTPSSSSTGAQAVSAPGFSDGKNISITHKEHTGFSSSQAIMDTKTQSITQPKGASPIKQLFPFNTAISSTSEPMRNTMHAKDQAKGFLPRMSIETTVTPKLMPASAKHEAAEPEKIPTVPMKNTFEQKDQTLTDSTKHKPVKLEDFHVLPEKSWTSPISPPRNASFADDPSKKPFQLDISFNKAESVGKPISPPVSVSSDSSLSPPVLASIPPFSVSPVVSLAPLSSPLSFKHLQTTDNPLITSGLTGASTSQPSLDLNRPLFSDASMSMTKPSAETTTQTGSTSSLFGASSTSSLIQISLSQNCPSTTVPPNLGFVASSGPGLISSPSSTNGFSNTITSTLVNLSSPAPIVPAVSPTPNMAQPIPTNAIQPLADMKNETLDATILEEDGMEEEAPDPTNDMSLGSFGVFGLGSSSPTASKPNSPFGTPFGPSTQTSTSFSLSIPSGQLFRPASFTPPSIQPTQPDPSVFSSPSKSGAPPTMSAFGRPSQIGLGVSAFGQPAQIGSGASPFGQPSLVGGGTSGFGQPAQIRGGPQVLGSALGAFGQSRQLGSSLPGAGFASSSSGSASSVGGFAAMATAGDGFGAMASGGGGFAAAAANTGGGFQAFSNKQGGSMGGFSSFATSNASHSTGNAPTNIFTQIRK